jgi:dihydroorotate dehydrogenase
MNALKKSCEVEFLRNSISKNFTVEDRRISKKAFGLYFRNPVGLGAGFDKNALYIKELEALGFGFVEIGTVTPRPQAGNEKPRLFRLPQDKAVINRMGFNNDGVKAVAARLQGAKNNIIVGGNIGKNKDTPNDLAWKDYEICFNELFDHVDYFVVNVSSPNTPGLRELQERSSLEKILGHLQTINSGKLHPKPLLLKIAPDLTIGQLDDIIELSQEVELAGLVATNTTISREDLVTEKKIVAEIGAGGLSGQPVKSKSTKIVKYIVSQTNGTLPVVASGGIFTGQDAMEKLSAGATLLQVWTGFIYEGPSIVKNICNHLIEHDAY